MANNEGIVDHNPASQLFTPRWVKRATRRVLTGEEVATLLSVLDLREKLIAMLAIFAGMRPGEIVGLQWKHVRDGYVEVRQRQGRYPKDGPVGS